MVMTNVSGVRINKKCSTSQAFIVRFLSMRIGKATQLGGNPLVSTDQITRQLRVATDGHFAFRFGDNCAGSGSATMLFGKDTGFTFGVFRSTGGFVLGGNKGL